MSAGAFVLARYEVLPAVAGPPAIASVVTTVRTQPETVAAIIATVSNNAPTAGLTPSYPRALVGASSRRRGIVRTRAVRIRFTNTLPPGYKAGTIITIPWLLSASFNTFTDGAAGQYIGLAVELVGKREGSIR